MNWKLRVKRIDFWLEIIAVILTASGISPETLTSWGALWDSIVGILSNPYVLCTAIIAVIGVLQDHTTEGLGDSELAMSYKVPSKKTKTYN